MAFECLSGTFAVPASTGNLDVTLPFSATWTPKVVILKSTGSTSDGVLQDDAVFVMGWGISSTSEYCAATYSDHAVATSAVVRHHTTKVFSQVNVSGTVVAEASMAATPFAAGKFTLNWSTVTTNGQTVEWLALGGSDITPEIGSFTMETATGNKSYATTNTPSVVFFLTVDNDEGVTTPPDTKTDRSAGIYFGAMTASGEGSMVGAAEDGTTSPDTTGVDASAGAHLTYSLKSGGWAKDSDIRFVSFDSAPNGFTVNYNSAPAAGLYASYLAISGSNWDFVSATAPTSTGTQTLTNSGFVPSGMLAFGVGATYGASLGWASNHDGTKANTAEGASFWSDSDAAGTTANTDTDRLTDTGKALVLARPAFGATDNEAGVNKWNSDGLELDWTKASVAHTYQCLMFGAGTQTPATTFVPRMMMF